MARAPKLGDIQLILLSTASQRADGNLLPPPESLSDQLERIRKAVAALIKRAFVAEIDVDDASRSWRQEADRKIGVIITDDGRAAIGSHDAAAENGAENSIEPISEAKPETTGPADESVVATEQMAPATETSEFTVRAGSKQALVVDLLRRDTGASITEITEATGWLPHTT